MSGAKEELTRIIAEQPEDGTQEEIVRELALRFRVRRGLDDADAGRTISNEEMRSRSDCGRTEMDAGSRVVDERYLRVHRT